MEIGYKDIIMPVGVLMHSCAAVSIIRVEEC